jgi:hypothetical protein
MIHSGGLVNSIRVAVLVSLATGLALPSRSGEINDWLIVPGQRVGPITAKTTRADLVRIFGSNNIEDGDVTVADDVNPGTLVFKSQPDAALGITWNDDSPEPHVGSIQICATASKCRWHTDNGITLGLTLRAVEKMNGRPFKLLGFEWDWEGTVVSWNDGHLEKLMHACAGLSLRLLPKEDQSVPERFVGDHEILSSEPEMQALNPMVSIMSFGFEPLEGCKK